MLATRQGAIGHTSCTRPLLTLPSCHTALPDKSSWVTVKLISSSQLMRSFGCCSRRLRAWLSSPTQPSLVRRSTTHGTLATASTRRFTAAYTHGLAWYPSSTAFLLSHLLHWGAFEPNGKTPSTASCAGWTGLGAREKNLFNSRQVGRASCRE